MRCACSIAAAAAHARLPDYLNPGAEFLGATWPIRACSRGRCAGVDVVCHQAAMVGLGVGLRSTSRDYVRDNDLGHRRAAQALGAGRLRRPRGPGQQHGRLRRGRLPLRRSRRGRPRARATAPTWRPGRFEPRCPRCALRARAVGRSPRASPLDPAQRLRGHQAPPGAPVRRLRPARPGCRSPRCATTTSTGRGCPATPRTPGVASIFASALAARPGAAGLRGRRPAARLRPRAATWRAPT